jgi:hypothetical protein
MKTQSRKFQFLSIVTLFFIGIAFSASVVGAFNLFSSSLERDNKEGAVSVIAEYLPTKNSKEEGISFRLILNTHSVDLEQYDIQNLSSLIIDKGTPTAATKWEPSGAGHHFKGILHFSETLPSGKHQLQLVVRNLDNVKERVFEWQFP